MYMVFGKNVQRKKCKSTKYIIIVLYLIFTSIAVYEIGVCFVDFKIKFDVKILTITR